MDSSNFDLSALLAKTPKLSFKQRLLFVWSLSVPGIFAQISSIVMQYIDAAMVGSLGANASAAIGLVASSTWVLGSLCNALCIGFTVQVAHKTGAGEKASAKAVFFRSILTCLVFSVILAAAAFAVHKRLPLWLGAESAIQEDAAFYFLIFGLSSPLYQLVFLMSGMLQCSGNMKVPSILNVVMCLLDAAFNVIFIKFLGLGVKGAALGSACSAFVVAVIITYFAVYKSDYLNLRHFKAFGAESNCVPKAVKLALPVAVEQVAFTGALVAVTKIIAPLGATALAANSFATTAEALCYMPGYGIQEAATTLVGQSVGAKRPDLTRSFSKICVFAGMIVMAVMGLIMYFVCPAVFAFLTPDVAVRELATKVLRIELLAEPFFAAAIVSTGALRGKGDTLIPGILTVVSLWIVRLGLSLFLVRQYALTGIWIAMAAELTFRGIVMMARLFFTTRKQSAKDGNHLL